MSGVGSGLWFSKCSPQKGSISITWERVRNARSQAPQTYCIINYRGKAQESVFYSVLWFVQHKLNGTSVSSGLARL